MAYRLPPPWDSGYAIPGNVRDEGLERHAIITKWMPRGTYDNTPVRNVSNFAIPQYIRAEDPGQGAKVTKWAPSGTYSGPRIPHWLNQRPARTVSASGKKVSISRPSGRSGMQGLGATPTMNGADVLALATDDVFPEPWGSYGVKAATTILSNLQKLPRGQRKPALQKILGSVDPTLWNRTDQITNRYLAQGKPPAQALHAGLARAMSAGIVAELHRTGKTQKYPAPNSLLGLGCYGCTMVQGALGAVEIAPPGVRGAAQQTSAISSTSTQVFSPTAGSSVTPADGSATSDGKLIWGNGQWHIAAPSDQPTVYLGYDSSGPILQAQNGEFSLYVGNFAFDIRQTGAHVKMLTSPGQFDQSSLAWIAQAVAQGAQKAITNGNAPQCAAAFWDTTLTGPCNGCPSVANFPAAQCQSTYDAFVALGQTTWATWVASSDAVAFDPMSKASGAPKIAKTIATATDASGSPCHTATFTNDPNTYRFYTFYDWVFGSGIAGALTPRQLLLYWYNGGYGFPSINVYGDGFLRTGLTNLFACFQGNCSSVYGFQTVVDPAYMLAHSPPLGLFMHPVTGKPWGLWMALVKDAGSSDGVKGPAAGDWNENSDAPEGWHFEIGFAPMETVTTWQDVLSDILDVIVFVPAIILQGEAAVLGTVGGALATLACQAVASPTAAAGVSAAMGGPKNPAAGVAVLGVAIAQGLCGSPTPPAPPASSLGELLLIGGVALAAVLLLTRK